MSLKPSFWQASIEELMAGYHRRPEAGRFTCLFCGYETEQGRIYPEGDLFYDAEKQIQLHIAKQHESSLNFLLQLDKRWTGLTELQIRLIRFFAAGVADQDIAVELGSGSISTVRNHRFLLREKLKQAKIFLAIGKLMENQAEANAAQKPVPPKAHSDPETAKILATYFPQGVDGPLSIFPTREKRRLILLRQIITRFDSDRVYSEKEVNAILEKVYHDHVTIRRLLIDYGFLARRIDGSEYWRKPPASEIDPIGQKEGEDMLIQPERKKELLREYKETPRPMGVFQIKNNVTGKVFLVKALDLPGIINRHKLELERSQHRNGKLQADWNQYGAAAFSFDVLATLKPEEFLPEQWPKAVENLFEEWLEKLQPYDEAGYNKKASTPKSPVN